MKKFLIILLLLGLAGGGVAWWLKHNTTSSTVTFRTIAVERGDLLATISATGTIEPEEVVDVGAQVAGQIRHFGRDLQDSSKAIDYGSVVEEGTVLAQIDDAIYRAQVDAARATLQKCEADLLQMKAKLQQNERDFRRAQTLAPRKAISDLDYDTAQAGFETAKATLGVGEASVGQAKAALMQTEINLNYSTIKSPVKGTIVDRRVNVGQTVVASLNAPSLFLIAKDLKRLQVWASVNEADIGQIHPGQVVRFTVDAFPNETFRGEVLQIRLNATMTQNVVTYTVVVTTDNSSGKLLPYLTANLQFEVDRHEDVLLVPNTALRWRPQLPQVAPEHREAYTKSRRRGAKTEQPEKDHQERGTLWVEDNGFVRPVRLKVGLSDGIMTETVTDELNEGDEVVISESRQTRDTSVNPFLPQMSGKKKD